MTTFPLLQDIRRSSIDVQFVDEHRIFGVSHGLDPDSPQLVTLLDTSTSAENPQEPREIVFELGNLEGPVSLIEGTHAQGAKLGPSFRTNPKKHVLGIACTPISQQHRSFVINYESLCTIASENESSSHIPWDFWKHKTTQIGHYTGFSPSLTLVGPRAFVMGEDNSQGPQLWCFDFTPGAYRSTKRLDPPSEVAPPHVTRCATLPGWLPEWYRSRWTVSEDTVSFFCVSLQANHSQQHRFHLSVVFF